LAWMEIVEELYAPAFYLRLAVMGKSSFRES
jgi:hypothetical protein